MCCFTDSQDFVVADCFDVVRTTDGVWRGGNVSLKLQADDYNLGYEQHSMSKLVFNKSNVEISF